MRSLFSVNDRDDLIVVTGAAGLIGSGVVRELNDRGYKNLLLVDDLGEDNRWKNLVGKSFLDIIGKGDIFDWLEGKEELIGGFIHLGACSDTMERDCDYLLENNFHYSVCLAEYALQHEKRFIYASSAATYGLGEMGFSDDEELLEELRPLNMYGYSKQLFDLWLKREGVLDQVVGLKYFNVFGPNEYHKGRMASAVCQMYPKVEEEGEICLFKSLDTEKMKDGEQERDFIYVKDAVRITCDFLENKCGGIFNVGTGIATTWNELGKALFTASKKEPKIKYIDMPEGLKKQYQDFTKADVKKLEKCGLMKNMTPFKEAVDDYVNNYLKLDARW